MRKIKAVFTSSKDSDFDCSVGDVLLLAPNIILERDRGSGTVVRIIRENVVADQDLVRIDLDECLGLEVEFLSLDNTVVDELGLDWIINAKFIDILRAFAEK